MSKHICPVCFLEITPADASIINEKIHKGLCNYLANSYAHYKKGELTISDVVKIRLGSIYKHHVITK